MKPARLGKQQEINVSPFNFSGWMLLHPTAILLAGLIIMLIVSALIFAVNGGSAVESGSMRNFLVNGV